MEEMEQVEELSEFGISDDGANLVSSPEGATRSKSCPKCRSEFPSMTLLYKHKRQCQMSFKAHHCWSCGRTFTFRVLLLSHRCARSRKRKLDNKKQLRLNLAEAKGLIESPEEKPAAPAPAPKSESNATSDDAFEKLLPVTCPKCKEKFSSPKYFHYHLVHNLCAPEISTCKICGRDFDDLEEMKFHQVRCEEKRNMINKLKDKYVRLKEQQESIKKRTFSCRACGKGFSTPQLLKTHLYEQSRCIVVHNMKIKLRCHWERGGDLSQSARKSFPNLKTVKHEIPEPSPQSSGSPVKYSWESASSSTSSEGLKAPIIGAARKTFRNPPQATTAAAEGAFCDVCYRYFPSSDELRTHKAKHFVKGARTAPSVSKCPECHRSFQDIVSLKYHQDKLDHWGKATKSMSSKCVCPFCDKEFAHALSRNSHLGAHAETHPDQVRELVRATTCSFCSQVFMTESLKIQHIRLSHGNFLMDRKPEPVKEEEVSVQKILESHKYVGYSNKNVLVNLTPTIERQLKRNPNKCPVCFREYSTSFIRNRHFRTHMLDQAFECKFCPTRFPRSDRLLHHMQQEHNDYLAYECRQCSMRFTTRMRALQHATKVHPHSLAKSLIMNRNVSVTEIPRKPIKIMSDNNEAVIPEEEFYCDVCELSFLKLCGLQRHRQSKLHREILEKTKAQMPMKSYSQNAVLLDQRPPLSVTPPFIDYSKQFSCSTCRLEFESVSDFVPHRLSHFSSQNFGEKVNEINPYTCEICGKVMDNHQKIQLHLFWHLQDVQLQAGTKKVSSRLISPDISESLNSQPVAKKSMHRSAKQHTQELVIAGVKKQLYTCEFCNISFTTKQHYSVHVEQYCKLNKGSVESKASIESSVTAGFCKICGCIFSSSILYEEHKSLFCNKNTFIPLDENPPAIYTEMVKSLMKLDTMVAGCVRCNLAFDSMEALSEHSSQHTQNQDISDVVTEEGEAVFIHDKSLSICMDSGEMQIDNEADGSPVLEPGNENYKLIKFDGPLMEMDHNLMALENPNVANDSEEDTEGNIDSLREKFSQLLCVLVSDLELMEQLGYGKSTIDEVLVNVLNQMGLVPVPADEVCSELERLRRNIRTLLDVCIKDQIMELIADGQATTDSIVSAALKMFGVEDFVPNPSDAE